MTSLRVICGLGPPNQKSWLRLCYVGKVRITRASKLGLSTLHLTLSGREITFYKPTLKTQAFAVF